MKLIGALLVIVACGGFGFHIAATHRKDMLYLRQLISVLDYMECELNYRLTPLPQLCNRIAAEHAKGVGEIFASLAEEMENQISPDIKLCMENALRRNKQLPSGTDSCMRQLSSTLGNYDLPGQLKGIESIRVECRRRFDELNDNKDARLRSYQALGLCAGAALAILLI